MNVLTEVQNDVYVRVMISVKYVICLHACDEVQVASFFLHSTQHTHQ